MIPSLWAAVQKLANGEVWPPESSMAADRFVARANQESLLPLLASEVELPPVVAQAVRRSAALAAAHRMRSALIAKALARGGALLEGEQYIVLKGCDFAHRLYPRPELRPMADIDVLVPENEIRRVVNLLVSRGVSRVALPGLAILAASHHEIPLSIDDITFEVHHRFVQKSRHRIDYAGVFARALPFEAVGLRALRLACSDAFTYETISIAIKYFTSPLIRFVDLWLLLEAEPSTLEASAARATEWAARHAYYGALRFASRIFPEFATEQFQAVLRQIVSRREAGFLDNRVVPWPEGGKATVPSRATQLWRKFWLLDSGARRTAFAVGYAGAAIEGAFRSVLGRDAAVNAD